MTPEHITSCLLTELFGRDEIDQSMDFVRIDDLIVVDPYEAHAPSHLVTADARRPLTVAGHHEWRESIATARPFDEVDEFVEELRAGEFEEKGSRL
jgi:hypothetical protein